MAKTKIAIMIRYGSIPRIIIPIIEARMAPIRSYTFSITIIGAVFVCGILKLVLSIWDFTSAPIWPGVISKAVPDKKISMFFFSGIFISQFFTIWMGVVW